ncbi:hypothetical protein HX037_04845 [Ignatzschineria indica]|nr:hypothetical protein [Ignatzschineria indica]
MKLIEIKRADELPEITTAYFHKLHAGKWRFSIADSFLEIKKLNAAGSYYHVLP